jgi:hypothetical protein
MALWNEWRIQPRRGYPLHPSPQADYSRRRPPPILPPIAAQVAYQPRQLRYWSENSLWAVSLSIRHSIATRVAMLKRGALWAPVPKRSTACGDRKRLSHQGVCRNQKNSPVLHCCEMRDLSLLAFKRPSSTRELSCGKGLKAPSERRIVPPRLSGEGHLAGGHEPRPLAGGSLLHHSVCRQPA